MEVSMSNTTTKRALVVKIASETGLTQLEVKEVIQRTLYGVTESLVQGKTVEFRNFVIF